MQKRTRERLSTGAKLVLASIALAFVVAMLFCPFRYRGQARTKIAQSIGGDNDDDVWSWVVVDSQGGRYPIGNPPSHTVMGVPSRVDKKRLAQDIVAHRLTFCVLNVSAFWLLRPVARWIRRW